MAEQKLVTFTPEQDAYLARIARQEAHEVLNQIKDSDHRPGPILSFMGQMKEPASVDLFEGPLTSPDNKVVVRKGPARADGTQIPFGGVEGITVHYLWGSIGEGAQPWCTVFEWFDRYYIVPLQCVAPV